VGSRQSRSGERLAAASVLLDPASLPTALLRQPQLLEHLSGADLGQSILLRADSLSGADFGGMLQAVGKVDLAKAQDLVEVLRDGNGLDGLLEKCVGEGVDFLSELTGIDLTKVAPLLDALRDGFEFLKTLKEVADSASQLFQQLADFDPLKQLRFRSVEATPVSVRGIAMSDSANVFTDLNRFSTRLERLLLSDAARQAPKIAKRLRAEKQLAIGIDALADALNMLASILEKLQGPLKKAEHVAAGCEAIADGPIADGLAAFGNGKSLGQVAKLCGQSDGAVQPLVDRIVQVRGPLTRALGILGSLPTPGELTVLRNALNNLASGLRALQQEVKTPNASVSTPTPSTPGGKLP